MTMCTRQELDMEFRDDTSEDEDDESKVTSNFDIDDINELFCTDDKDKKTRVCNLLVTDTGPVKCLPTNNYIENYGGIKIKLEDKKEKRKKRNKGRKSSERIPIKIISKNIRCSTDQMSHNSSSNENNSWKDSDEEDLYKITDSVNGISHYDNEDCPKKLCIKKKSKHKIDNEPLWIEDDGLDHGSFICDFEGCGREFITKDSLRKHQRMHAKDETYPFKCEYEGCDRVYYRKQLYVRHHRTHTGERPYVCPDVTCQRRFMRETDLRTHLRIHTGEKPYICEVEGCGMCFSDRSDFGRHKRTHSELKPFICQEEGCNKSFKRLDTLRTHLRFHTGERPYVCQIKGCKKSFPTSSSVHRHMRLHTGEKPYICPIAGCAKRFRDTSRLWEHTKTHPGEKRYFCLHDGCMAAFDDLKDLRVHKRVHSADRWVNFGPDFPDHPQLDQLLEVTLKQMSENEVSESVTTKAKENERDNEFNNKYTNNRNAYVEPGDDWVESSPFVCLQEKCNRGFSTVEDLEKHVLEHKM